MIRKLLVLILIVFIAALSVLTFIISTEAGLQWSFARLRNFVQGTLTVETLKGRLMGPIKIDGLTYKTADAVVSFNNLSLDWKPTRLLTGEIRVEYFYGEGLDVVFPISQFRGKPVSREGSPYMFLPFKVQLQDLTIKDITLHQGDIREPILINELLLKAFADKDVVEIESLQVMSPAIKTKAQGNIRIKDELLADIVIDWTADTPSYGRFKGAGKVVGNRERLQFTHQISAPFRATIDATITGPLSDIHWSAEGDVHGINPNAIEPSWPDTAITGHIKGAGNLAEINTTGNFETTYEPFGKLKGAFSLQRSPDRWKLEKVDLQIADSSTTLSAHGDIITTKEQTVANLQGEWETLSWPIKGSSLIHSPEGTFTIKGLPDDYELQLSGTMACTNIPHGYWTVSGKGDLNIVTLGTIRGELLNGVIQGNGMLRWKPEIQWNIAINGNGLNPGKAWKEWTGKLDLNVKADGTIKDGQYRNTVNVNRIHGILRDYPLKGSALFEIKNDRYMLSSLEIYSGPSRITASGQLADTWDVAWDIEAPNLDSLLPQSSGSLMAQGKIKGARLTPQIIASVKGEALSVETYRISSLHASLNLNFQEKKDFYVDLEMKDLRYGTQTVDSASLQGRGKMDNHELVMNVTAAQEALDIRLTGFFEGYTWNGLLKEARLRSAEYGHWKLENPGNVTLTFTHIQLEKVCFSEQASRLCGELTWKQKEEWHIGLSTAHLSLSLIQPFLPPDITLTGLLAGTIEAHSDSESLIAAEGALTLTSGAMSYPIDKKEKAIVAYQKSTLNIEVDEKGLNGSLEVLLINGDHLKGLIILPEFNTGKRFSLIQQIKGTVQGKLNKFEVIPLPLLFKDVEGTKGFLSIDLAVEGTLSSPLVSGNVAFTEGTAFLTRLGIHLREISVHGTVDQMGVVRYTGSAKSGKGIVDITGNTHLQAEMAWLTKMKITGEDFEVIKSTEAHVLVSPDIEMQLQGKRVDLNGELTIPEATIKPHEPTGAVPVSKDVVLIGDEAGKEGAKKFVVYSQVKVTLGEKVYFTGSGLTGRVTGSVLVVDEPDKLTTGQGELRLMDAQYEFQGKKLDIESGRIGYAGNFIEDPNLDIQAVRRVEEIIVGVKVRGTLKKPVMTLYSDPSMEQTDILSYLILGQPVDQVSQSEGKTLFAAASLLGAGSGDGLTKKIGDIFGLEELRIKSGTKQEETELVIGKYLSPRLYVNYSVGLFEPISTLRIRYKLSKKWFLQSETGVEKGADIIYTIER
jgi:translocation and assembly module TamB